MIMRLIHRIMRERNFSNSENFIKYLKKSGVVIGDHTHFFEPSSCVIDTTRPFLLEIGSSVKVTHGVIILTHDFSYSVLRIRYGDLLGECSKTKIGDNCFLGMNAIIMPGVTLGNNVIVGAGSVVTKSFPDDVVIAGNPAKVICSLDEFYKKRKDNLENDAIMMANAIKDKLHRNPTLKEMSAFFPLFSPQNEDTSEKLFSGEICAQLSGDSSDSIIGDFMDSESGLQKYESFDDFLKKSIIESE